MGVKRIVSTSFWNDDLVLETFTPEDKYFMLYLLTNPHTTQLGIYHLPIKLAAVEMGYSEESIRNLLNRFENTYNLVMYSKDTNEIAIKNYLKHSIVKGGKPVMDCLLREEDMVSNKALLEYIAVHINKQIDNRVIKNTTIIDYINHLNNILDINNTKSYINDLVNDNNNDNDNDDSYHDSYNDSYHDSSEQKKDSIDYKTIVDFLNEKAGTHYKHSTEKTKKLIRARMNEGFTLDDFKTVIEYKVKEWRGTKFEPYIRPETLFGTKFEGYLNNASKTTTVFDTVNDSWRRQLESW
jgi:uncharacterized phage protein (TIGR02220 family)